MAFTQAVPIRFQIGARTLLSLPRQMVRLAWSLDDVLPCRLRALPPLGSADGYLLTSVPESLLPFVGGDGLIAHPRQRYVRYHIDLTIGRAAWEAHLSANTRQALRRKAKRLASGGTLDVRGYRTPAEIAEFHALARPLSALTYQERLLDAGLPERADVLTLAASGDAVRAWLLFHEGAPIAYLCCGADGDTLRYDHVGHDPKFGDLSPGTVLMREALRVAVRRPLRALRLHRRRGSAQAPVRDRRHGHAPTCSSCARPSRTVSRSPRWPRSTALRLSPRRPHGRGLAKRIGRRDPPRLSCARCACRATRRRCTCQPLRSSSPSARMASMARWCGR